MPGKLPIRVLLFSADCDLVERWAAALSGDGFRIERAVAARTDGHADVVVTDAPGLGDMSKLVRTRIKRRAIAVVCIAGPRPGEATRQSTVVLPPDATGRELALACRLAGEMARLRRRVHRAASRRRGLVRLAETDSLTGLPNRRAWEREVTHRLRPAATGRRQCLAIIDLDHFKRFNDAHGHAAGDRLLATISRELRAALRQDDFVARLGGDEFGILLLADVEDERAAAIVERARRRIGLQVVAAIEPVRASAGYVVFTVSPETNGGTIFEAADRALAAAKQAGRDRSVVAATQ